MSDMKEIKNLAALRGCTVAAMLAASLSIGDGKTAAIKQPQPKLDTKEMPTAPNVSPVVDKPIVTPVIDSVNVEKDMPPLSPAAYSPQSTPFQDKISPQSLKSPDISYTKEDMETGHYEICQSFVQSYEEHKQNLKDGTAAPGDDMALLGEGLGVKISGFMNTAMMDVAELLQRVANQMEVSELNGNNGLSLGQKIKAAGAERETQDFRKDILSVMKNPAKAAQIDSEFMTETYQQAKSFCKSYDRSIEKEVNKELKANKTMSSETFLQLASQTQNR